MEALYDTVDGLTVGTCGPALPVAHNLTVPADISSAAFWMVAAASRPGSRLTLHQVGLNKTRNAVISALQRMGARMDIVPTSPEDAGEPYGDITVYGSDSLHGTSLLPEEIPNLIDEIPILAVAGALGRGDFIVRNARELRVKVAELLPRAVGAEEIVAAAEGQTPHGGKGAPIGTRQRLIEGAVAARRPDAHRLRPGGGGGGGLLQRPPHRHELPGGRTQRTGRNRSDGCGMHQYVLSRF